MATLYMLKGIPASGKSSWAKAEVERRVGKVVRVSKDDIRVLLHGGIWRGSKTEKQVVEAESALISTFLTRGVDVIADSTNLQPPHEPRLRELANAHSAEFVIKDFPIDVEEAIKRDLKRERPVGEAVIRRMWMDYLFKPETYVPPVGKPKALLIDVDGTVALMDGRGPFEWHRVGEDKPNEAVISVVRTMANAGYKIIFLSGRDSVCRADTEKWLFQHAYGTFELFMRPSGDSRKDSLVKRELFDAHVRDHYDVSFTMDDRDQVVSLWRSMGLPCFQVNFGNF